MRPGIGPGIGEGAAKRVVGAATAGSVGAAPATVASMNQAGCDSAD